jgi:two-component system, NarL family, response regulator DevR
MTSTLDNRSAERHRGSAPASSTHATRVLVVDDHPAVRWGLVQLLEDQPDIEVAAVATTAEVAVGQAENEAVDVAVVDYQLGGRNGLWVTRKLRELPAPPRVVIFSAFANDHLAANCAVAGANALLSKSSLGEDLCSTIRSVARGRVLLPRVPRTMVQLLRGRLDQEDQIAFGMLIAGIPETEVRRVLAVSAEELRQRRARMLAKLEALPGEVAGDERAERGDRAVSSYLGVERC